MVILDKSYAYIPPCWHDYENLPFVNEEFNDQESLAQWRALGYTQTKFTGDMYDMRRPEPVWMPKIREHFNWQHFSWSLYRMGPGTVLPPHRDTYTRFREIYNVSDPKKICRAIIFLRNWESGHYFEINGQIISSWTAGDTYIWRWDLEHAAANVGKTPRYTLQITGIAK